ncbi:MAG TPA: Rid family hydrolase [Prolixibacteraceae bacterium]|nr:Rid family hydrolase [Prolixibacteraceae bacterium]
MEFGKINTSEGTQVCYSVFRRNTADEYNLVITPPPGTSAAVQFNCIEQAALRFAEELHLGHAVIVFQRFFASDIANQASFLEPVLNFNGGTSVSVIQQPPAERNKLLAWIYLIDFHQDPVEVQLNGRSFHLSHNGYRHIYTSGLISTATDNSFLQMEAILEDYTGMLGREALTLEANCIRTWLFVRDIDNNYSGMVKARNMVFEREGLSHDTHFIASTGIEGQSEVAHSLVNMDAYAIGGISRDQLIFLKAYTHLSPTHDYGVAFERGTAVDYGDRRHVFISGTASIDHKGRILHLNDIEKQTQRTFENIGALLEEAGASMEDVASMIVYLRDLADTGFIRTFLNLHYPEVPVVVAIAPVCRPGWLVEVECTAVVTTNNPDFGNY